MPKIKFITTASDLNRCGELIRSLKRFEWDFHVERHEWTGFGSKLIACREALEKLPSDYTHFIYGDSYDSFVLGAPGELYGKVQDWESIIHSAEKANYPHPEKVYPETGVSHAWKYLNGGGFFAPVTLWKQYFDAMPCPRELNDQVYQTDRYLINNPGCIKLERDCDIFQCYSFIDEGTPNGNDGDFAYANGRLLNMVTHTRPLLIHGNGKTPLDRIYNLI